jgi:hypothetical protein
MVFLPGFIVAQDTLETHGEKSVTTPNQQQGGIAAIGLPTDHSSESVTVECVLSG